MPFAAHFTELADDQLPADLAWAIVVLRDVDDPGSELNSRAVHQGQPRIKRGVCLALVCVLELISVQERRPELGGGHVLSWVGLGEQPLFGTFGLRIKIQQIDRCETYFVS